MSTHTAFCDRTEFSEHLTNNGGNSNLIDYLRREVVANEILCERLLKGIADELPMKKEFDAWN